MDGVSMIDEQTIREKAAELEHMMQRLERFRETGYTRETCSTCQWQRGEVLDEEASKNPAIKKVYEHFKNFKKNISAWNKTSEVPYHTVLNQ